MIASIALLPQSVSPPTFDSDSSDSANFTHPARDQNDGDCDTTIARFEALIDDMTASAPLPYSDLPPALVNLSAPPILVGVSMDVSGRATMESPAMLRGYYIWERWVNHVNNGTIIQGHDDHITKYIAIIDYSID